jgi:anti-sigma-K factor RskA
LRSKKRREAEEATIKRKIGGRAWHAELLRRKRARDKRKKRIANGPKRNIANESSQNNNQPNSVDANRKRRCAVNSKYVMRSSMAKAATRRGKASTTLGSWRNNKQPSSVVAMRKKTAAVGWAGQQLQQKQWLLLAVAERERGARKR